MNYRGSYKKLLGNAKSAAVAAIEIYNKPKFEYRDECAVILLLNAWELALKAILSKNNKSIYYPKERNSPYKTLSWQDALSNAGRYFPAKISCLSIRSNLEALANYRNNAIHFYNAKDFSVVLYPLTQTSIKNFRDILYASFEVRLEDDINWEVLPIGIRPPIDVVSYISGKSDAKMSRAVQQFLSELVQAADELRAAGEDTGRLLTVFDVKLESVKKIGEADIAVGVGQKDASKGPLAIVRIQDPNKSHPLRRKDVLEKIPTLFGRKFTSYIFQAIVWKYKVKRKERYCWTASEGNLTRYSNDVVMFIKRLSKIDIDAALMDYRDYRKSKKNTHKG